MTAAEDATEALRLAREALALAEAAARAAGVEAAPREITVERIRIVDSDGGLRLVIAARTDEIYLRGQAVPHPSRTQAGLIYVNDVGTECGGLVWDGSASATGGQLSLDSFEQDQAITVRHEDEDGVRTSAIQFVDQPAWSLADFLVGGHVGEEEGAGAVTRMRLAKEPDGSVGLTFRDQEGRERLRLGLDKFGHPSLELLGPNGGHAGGVS